MRDLPERVLGGEISAFFLAAYLPMKAKGRRLASGSAFSVSVDSGSGDGSSEGFLRMVSETAKLDSLISESPEISITSWAGGRDGA